MVRPSTINKLDDPLDCCCPALRCVVHGISFNSLDPSETIPDFTEISGDWSLIEDPDDPAEVVLTEAGNVGAQLICDKGITYSSPDDVNMIVSIEVRATTGIKPRQYVNWKDSTNYFYSQYDYDAERLSIHDKSGAELTSIHVSPPVIGTTFSWQTCITKFGTLSVNFDSLRDYVCVTSIPGGNKAGIGNGSSVQTYWIKFALIDHYWSNRICPFCLCTCNGECIKKQLLVTLTDEGGCPNLDGIEIIINLYEYEGVEGILRWNYGFGVDAWICYPEEENHACRSSWTLTCQFNPDDPSDISGWRFESDETGAVCDGLDFLRFPDLVYSTCDPFVLVFRNISIREEPTAFCCNEGGESITATVTEMP